MASHSKIVLQVRNQFLSPASVEEDTFTVFVDDHAMATGSMANLTGNVAKAWYDGVTFAPVVESPKLEIESLELVGNFATLTWITRPVEWLLSPQTYTVQKSTSLGTEDWESLATGMLFRGFHNLPYRF